MPKTAVFEKHFHLPIMIYIIVYCRLPALRYYRIRILSHFQRTTGERPTQVQSRYFMHKKQCARANLENMKHNKQITIGRSRLICFIRIPLWRNLFILGIVYAQRERRILHIRQMLILNTYEYWTNNVFSLYMGISILASRTDILIVHKYVCGVQGSRDSQVSIQLKLGIE